MDDTDVVNTGIVEVKPAEPEAAAESELPTEPEEVAAEPAAPPARPRVWSMPQVKLTKEQTDELSRAAIRFGAGVASVLRRVAGIGARCVRFGWQLIRQVPPLLQLFGALGIALLLSIAGSVALGNALGRTCAVVFVPAFALALGAVAHHWYLSQNSAAKTAEPAETRPTLDLARSVEYVDSKLAFALNALGTDRQQQAVIALIQAKTATELSFGTAQEPVRPSLRPRIRAGNSAKMPQRENVSIVGRA